jgi:hypothetical protein
MSFSIYILLTNVGSQAGPFNLYSDVDNYAVPFDTNVPKTALTQYYSASVPDGTESIRVKSLGDCVNFIDISINNLPLPSVTPTNTPTITPTKTVTPTVTQTPGLTSSPTPSVTPTNTATPTITPTITSTQGLSPTPSVTPTLTPTITNTPSITPTNSGGGCQSIYLYPNNSTACSHSGSLTQYETDNSITPTRIWLVGECNITPVTGGNQWFSQGPGANSYQVDNGGFVISTTLCP